jgi:hypothetical protein
VDSSTSGAAGAAQGSADADPEAAGAFRDAASRRRPALAVHLAAARMAFAGGELRIYFAPDGELHRRALDRPTNRQILEEAAGQIWGPGCRVTVGSRSRDEDAGSASDTMPRGSASGTAEELAREASTHPTVQAVLDIFGGTVRAVEPHARAREE